MVVLGFILGCSGGGAGPKKFEVYLSEWEFLEGKKVQLLALWSFWQVWCQSLDEKSNKDSSEDQ